MDSYRIFGFLEILRQSIKVLAKSSKLMALIAILYFMISLGFVMYAFSILPFIPDLIINGTSLLIAAPNSSEFGKLFACIKQNFETLMSVGFSLLHTRLFSVIPMTMTIFVSAMSYHDNNLSFSDFLSRASRSWLRLLVTGFNSILLAIGYTCCVVGILIHAFMISDHPVTTGAIFIVVSILASIFFLYLSVVWVLALVVSVIEGSYGIEALGKATALIKGNRLHGFILNFLFMLLSLIMLQGCRMIRIREGSEIQKIAGFCLVSSISLVHMFQLLAYTVLYFQCKKNHDKETELQGSFGCSQILFVNEDAS